MGIECQEKLEKDGEESCVHSPRLIHTLSIYMSLSFFLNMRRGQSEWLGGWWSDES